MRWIGQNIYDLISRFRSDVYLESVSSGTIASGGNLGLDSNNKIVKATATDGDITGVTAGTGLSGGGTSGTVTLNVDAAQSQITEVGTIGTGGWEADVIASAYLDADTAHLSVAQTYTAQMTFDGDKNVTPGDGAAIHVDNHTVTDTNTSASGTAAMYTHVNIERPRLAATNSSVTTTAAASLYVQGAPTAHTNQTITNNYALWVDDGLVKFDGALTVGGTITGNVTGNLTGNADTVTTNANLTGHVTSSGNATTLAATQPTIESIGTDGDTTQLLGDLLYMANATTNKPEIRLINNTDDTTSPVIQFLNERKDGGATQAGEDNDLLGKLVFAGYDDQGTPGYHPYAQIYSDVHDATSGEESGRLTLQVANHDGGLGAGLTLTGGSANNVIDVQIGLGTSSETLVSGNFSASGNCNIDANHSYNIDDTAIISDSSGTATLSNIDALDATTEATIESAIDTLSNLTTTGTIGTGVWQGTAIASAYLDADTAHLSGTQTFTGAKTFTDTVALTGTGQITGIDTVSADTDAASKGYVDRPAKQIQIYHANWKGAAGTDLTYLPLAGVPDESIGSGSSVGAKESNAIIMPAAGKIKEIILRQHWTSTITTSDDITWTVYNRASNKKMNAFTAIGSTFDMVNPTQAGTDANNTRTSGEISYAFNEYDAVVVSMQWASTGPTNNADRHFVTVVVEYDFSGIGY